jgi:hypothetical protein
MENEEVRHPFGLQQRPRDGEDRCPSPLVYSFAYSSSSEHSLERISDIIEAGGAEAAMAAAERPTNHIPITKKAALEEPYPIGRTCCGRVCITSGFFNEYWYENQDFSNSRLLKAYRRICGFDIYTPKGSSEAYVGSLKANLFGTRYVLHQPNKSPIEIRYRASFFKRLGPRSFSVSFLGTVENGSRAPIVMRNKEPYYNVETNSYSLNFNGRVTTPSVKNFQLIHPLDPTYVTLTFGKISKTRYILDYTFPWAGIQAFAVALAALDYKIGCD